MNLDPLASYVKQREGQRVIRKILISNNGMAAVKAGSWVEMLFREESPGREVV